MLLWGYYSLWDSGLWLPRRQVARLRCMPHKKSKDQQRNCLPATVRKRFNKPRVRQTLLTQIHGLPAGCNHLKPPHPNMLLLWMCTLELSHSSHPLILNFHWRSSRIVSSIQCLHTFGMSTDLPCDWLSVLSMGDPCWQVDGSTLWRKARTSPVKTRLTSTHRR